MMNGYTNMKIRNQQRWERSRAYQKKQSKGYHQRLQAKLLKAQQAANEKQQSLSLLESEKFLSNPAYAEQKSTTSETSSKIEMELRI